MTKNRKEKKEARDLAAGQGISYTEALRIVRGQLNDSERRQTSEGWKLDELREET